DAVDVSGRLLVTQRWNDEEVDGQADRDAEGEFADALAEQGLLTVETAAEDEDRGRGDGHALIPDPAQSGTGQSHEQRQGEGPETDAEEVADEERDPDSDGCRHRSLDAAGERAVDRGVDGQQRRPGREERHL